MKGAKITITEYNVYDVYLNRSYNVFLVSVSIAIEQLSHLKVAKNNVTLTVTSYDFFHNV